MPTMFDLGFSPCPNDTFIFDALVQGKIPAGELSFRPVLADIETLNEWALEGRLPFTKMSFPTLFRVTDRYRVLRAGSALGRGCGPLLVARGPMDPGEVEGCRIAIPGVHTTANMLLSHAFPRATDRVPMVFSAIEDAVASGEADLGLLIHESRFTFRDKGLHQVADLGAYWEEKTGHPIPLACIAARRDVPEALQRRTDALIRQSLEYAFGHYPPLPPFVTDHAQAMDPEVMRRHIELYVNDFSLDLGPEGQEAIVHLMRQFPGDGTAADLFR